MGLVGVTYRFGFTSFGKITMKTEAFGRFRFIHGQWISAVGESLELIGFYGFDGCPVVVGILDEFLGIL